MGEIFSNWTLIVSLPNNDFLRIAKSFIQWLKIVLKRMSGFQSDEVINEKIIIKSPHLIVLHFLDLRQ